MKRGTSIRWDSDIYGRSVVLIQKRRGHLTLDEITDILQHENDGAWNSRYAILLNCSEATLSGNGLFVEEMGDSAELYQLEQDADCPVCGQLLPPFEYCPSCGAPWREMANSVEKQLAAMRHGTGVTLAP